ncbi:adenosine deaminase [Helicobacter enhydrae]|uniref:Adenine deaminase n=1 Tax=Helicobacter enhydrae TaxID=222136 RepID=A0A1B1U479_9HELI|nr:adenosine deaminase [Helicobacter enhydrae]ANV97559.1 adenosine deaminase [Helicobacter enhydrae]
MDNQIKASIQKLPKTELHVHLEGTLEADFKAELARKNQIALPHSDSHSATEYRFENLTSFLEAYYSGMEVLRTQEDFYNLAMRYFHKAKENNICYVEAFFDPQAHTSRGIEFATFFEGYYQATQDAQKLGIQARLIMCFLRDLSAESAMETYQQALKYKDRILGIGLDSDEKGNPPSKFAEVFKRAQEDGFPITIHCDIDQQNSICHIKEALLDLKTNRLDHGTNVLEDPSLVQYLKEHQIGLTCCPMSNEFITGDMKGKEIIELLRQGVKVTINSDDPAYFRGYVNENLFQLAMRHQLSKEEIRQLVENGFEVAWMSPQEREGYLCQVREIAL